jgi:hypothetical protein
MWTRRYIVLISLGAALAYTYRRALHNHLDDPSGWVFFVAVWLPSAILLGLFVTYAWPRVARWWAQRRR